MKERPILFSAPMVRALLDGTKTQTRRICKSQPYANGFQFDGHDILCHNDYLPPSTMLMDVKRGPYRYTTSNAEGWEVECPYGQPGDQLWVRETHAPQPDCSLAWEKWLHGAGGEKPIIHYAADASERAWVEKWRPSIHMPRWASRIDLEVTGVRVERLQDISEADAEAEGCERLDSERDVHDWKLCPQCGGTGLYTSFGPNLGACPDTDCQKCDTYVKRYQHLWESINGPDSWTLNPWVWVVTFRSVRAGDCSFITTKEAP